jgi:hypothetical protein
MADEREKESQQETEDTSAPILDYRPRGARQPQQVADSRHLEPGDGCARAGAVILGFLYGILAPIFVFIVVLGSRASDATTFTTVGCVLGIPAFAVLWFRAVRWAALGILLAVGVYLLIAGICASMFQGL